ncbi:M3 family metallopeptidase, partial [Enterobacter hormaechei]|uniref:M3 family metallopeptidase n=1 Tax=Enterobacter hormaechei TaxID=158836 RepID=UPI001EF884F5
LEIAAVTRKMDEDGGLQRDETLHFHVEPFEGANLQPEALAFISGHYQSGEPLPKAMLDKLLAAKNYQAALFILRQLEFGLFDFRMHFEYSPEKGAQILPTLAEVKKMVAVVPSPS